MMEKSQYKVLALTFSQNLQRSFRAAVLYSVEHSAAERHLQQAFCSLQPLFRSGNEFTLGFRDRRIVLNDIVTADGSFAYLESDFTKRGIRGVTFASGITFQQFKQGIGVLTTKPSVLQQNGGIAAILARKPLEGMEVLTAEDQKGDALLETDAQSYLKEQIPTGSSGAVSLPGLRQLLRLGGVTASASYSPTPRETLELVRNATEAALVRQESSSQKVVAALAHVLDEVTPEYLVSAMPSQRQAELHGLSVHQIAGELSEDIFLQWATNRLAAASPGADGMKERREVARVLSYMATTAESNDRLRRKLANLLQSAKLPRQVMDQLHQELTWNLLSPEEKYSHLIGLTLFSEADFFHLISCIQESAGEAEQAKARELALHYGRQYFASVRSAPPIIQAEWLARVPELLEAGTSLRSEEWLRVMVQGLCQLLLEEPSDRDSHSHVAAYLSVLAQRTTQSEDYESTLKIGFNLEHSLTRDPVAHVNCCQKALGNLLSPRSVESLIDLSLQKTDDPAGSKAIFSLLKLAAAQVSEIALDLIDKEADVPKRLRVLRVCARLGPRAIAAVRTHLTDERWYMVRNAVFVLAGLGDPDLPIQLEQALRHADSRVQQAAVNALIKCSHAARGNALARSLPFLPAHLQEAVLDALVFLKDPAAVSPLEEFLLRGSGARVGTMGKVIQVLAGIPGEAAVKVLGEVLMLKGQAAPLRKSAMTALLGCSSAQAKQILAELASNASTDPLAAELLTASSAKPA